jgi:hypothetical protein
MCDLIAQGMYTSKIIVDLWDEMFVQRVKWRKVGPTFPEAAGSKAWARLRTRKISASNFLALHH